MLGKCTSGGLEPSLGEGRDGRAWKVKESSKRTGQLPQLDVQDGFVASSDSGNAKYYQKDRINEQKS